jgi:hypothetical protein
MTLLYAYCGLCWLLMLYRLWDAFQQVRRSGYLRDKQAWCSLAAGLYTFILAPLLLPIYTVLALVGWGWSWRDRKTVAQLRKYRDYLFEPVAPDELPAEVAVFFEKHTDPLQGLQFRLIDDYWQWREPIPYIERTFISPDGRSFAAVSVIEEIRCVTFFSVLDDQSYLETSLALYQDSDMSTSGDPSGRLKVEPHTTGTIEDLFRRHEQRLDEATGEAFSYQPEDVRAVAIYGSRLLGQGLYAEGQRDEPPPPAELPQPEMQMQLG